MWSVKRGVGSVEREVKCDLRSEVKCAVRSAKCEDLRVEWRVRSVKCAVRSVQCEMWSGEREV